MPTKAPKLSEMIGLRLDPDTRREFAAALAESDLAAQDALRLAAKAMIQAYRRFGRIPHDMEIRQAQIGDLTDLPELVHRLEAVAEAQSNYLVKHPKKPPEIPKSPKSGGTGPTALVSDRPA